MSKALNLLLSILLFFSMTVNVSALQTSKSSDSLKTPTIKAIFTDGNKMFVMANAGIKPNVMRLKSPERLVLTIPNAKLDRTFDQPIYVPSSHPIIRQIRYANFSNKPPTVRVVADLRNDVPFQISDAGSQNLIISLSDQEPLVEVKPADAGLTEEQMVEAVVSRENTVPVTPEPMLTPVPSPVLSETGIEMVSDAGKQEKQDTPDTPDLSAQSAVKLTKTSVVKPEFKFTFDHPVEFVKEEMDGELLNLRLKTRLDDAESIERLNTVLKQAISIRGLKESVWNPDASQGETIIGLTLRSGYAALLSSDEGKLNWTVQIKAVKARVVIDAGHGGKDVGAISVSKKYEKDFTLDMAKLIEAELKKMPGIEPVLTRSDDRFLSLDTRAAFAAKSGADLFISIHGNSNERRSIRGTETYYFGKESAGLANALHKEIVKAAKLPDRKVRSAKFIVLRNNTVPSALLEIGYMSNVTDESNMMKKTFRSNVAKAIASGIADYAGQLAP